MRSTCVCVWESLEIRLPWKQETAGSKPATQTKYGSSTTGGALGSEPRGCWFVPNPPCQCSVVLGRDEGGLQIAECEFNSRLRLHVPMARMDRPLPSKRTHAGSNPARNANFPTVARGRKSLVEHDPKSCGLFG